jgi:hypothetical protein
MCNWFKLESWPIGSALQDCCYPLKRQGKTCSKFYGTLPQLSGSVKTDSSLYGLDDETGSDKIHGKPGRFVGTS